MAPVLLVVAKELMKGVIAAALAAGTLILGTAYAVHQANVRPATGTCYEVRTIQQEKGRAVFQRRAVDCPAGYSF